MFCKNCGKEVGDQAAYCPFCGSTLSDDAEKNAQAQRPAYEAQQPYPPVQDSGSAGWGVLGFFIPLVGLILFLVWKDSKPRSAKAAGVGALVSVIVYVVLMIIIGVVGGLMVAKQGVNGVAAVLSIL